MEKAVRAALGPVVEGSFASALDRFGGLRFCAAGAGSAIPVALVFGVWVWEPRP